MAKRLLNLTASASPGAREESVLVFKWCSVVSSSRKRVALIVAFTVAITSAVDLGAEGQRGSREDRKFDERLRERVTQGSGDDAEPVILRLRPGAKSSVLRALQAKGASVTADHSIIEAVSVKMSRKAMRELAKSDDVETISTDADVFADGIVSAVTGAALNQAYTLAKTVGVDITNPSTPTGRNVTVAVIDSGLLQVDQTSKIKTTRDFTTGAVYPQSKSAADGYGHGTHVAGIIASELTEVRGLAPGVNMVSLQVLDSQGVGKTSHVIRAIEWAVAYRYYYGIDVLNLSLGHPIYEPAASDPLVQAVEAASRAGIVVVVSAGNVGTNRETGQVGLCRHHVPRECALRHHRWRHQDLQHHSPHR